MDELLALFDVKGVYKTILWPLSVGVVARIATSLQNATGPAYEQTHLWVLLCLVSQTSVSTAKWRPRLGPRPRRERRLITAPQGTRRRPDKVGKTTELGTDGSSVVRGQ